jgi:hypothetical protein
MSRHQASVSSVVAHHAAVKNPTVTVLGYALAGEGLARVIVDVAHNRFSREDHNLVSESLSKMFDNHLAPVVGSFMSLDKAPYTERIAGIVRVNTQSVPMSAAKDFRSVSSNIFMDDEDKMWVLRKTEAGDILVKNTGIEDHESLRGLLDVVCSSGYSLSSEFNTSVSSIKKMQSEVQGGSYIQYVSALSTETKFGFVVASTDDGKLIVLPSDGSAEEGEVVEQEAVVSNHDTDEMPDVETSEQEKMDEAVSVSRGVVGISVLLDYYKKVFARSPKFYAEFAKRVKGHAFM